MIQKNIIIFILLLSIQNVTCGTPGLAMYDIDTDTPPVITAPDGLLLFMTIKSSAGVWKAVKHNPTPEDGHSHSINTARLIYKYQWFRSSTNDNTNGVAIENANYSNYVPQIDDLGKYLYVRVIATYTNTTPEDHGKSNTSEPVGVITATYTEFKLTSFSLVGKVDNGTATTITVLGQSPGATTNGGKNWESQKFEVSTADGNTDIIAKVKDKLSNVIRFDQCSVNIEATTPDIIIPKTEQ